jgi:hypothetical protein
MNMVPFAFDQPLRENGWKKRLDCAVVEGVWRCNWQKRKIDRNAMALVCPDHLTVRRQSEALFVASADDAFQTCAIKREGQGCKKRIDSNPAVGIKTDPDLARVMPQGQAEKSAYVFGAFHDDAGLPRQ